MCSPGRQLATNFFCLCGAIQQSSRSFRSNSLRRKKRNLVKLSFWFVILSFFLLFFFVTQIDFRTSHSMVWLRLTKCCKKHKQVTNRSLSYSCDEKKRNVLTVTFEKETCEPFHYSIFFTGLFICLRSSRVDFESELQTTTLKDWN